MRRFIKLDIESVVMNVRKGLEILNGEIESELGEIGQVRQADGSFFTPSIPEPERSPSTDERLDGLQLDNTVLFMALTDIYAEIQNLKGGE